MRDDRAWKFVLFLGGLIVVFVFIGNFNRKAADTEHAEVVAPNGNVLQPESPVVIPGRDGGPDAPLPVVDQARSREEWRKGSYKVVPGDPALLILQNSHEQRAFFPRETRVGACSFDFKKLCLRTTAFEAMVIDDLPESVRMPMNKRPGFLMGPGLEASPQSERR